jgi:hypothetical protein
MVLKKEDGKLLQKIPYDETSKIDPIMSVSRGNSLILNKDRNGNPVVQFLTERGLIPQPTYKVEVQK